MLQHFSLIALRSFARFKSTFIINVIGLSTGLACTLFIYLWVQDELAVDAFHENGDRLYQVMTNHNNSDGIVTMDATPDPLAETLALEVPEVEYAAAATPSFWFGDFVLEEGENKIKARGEFAGNDFLKMFTIPVERGNPASLLTDPNSVVISQSLAERIFKSQDVVGRTLTWRLVSLSNEVTITGVFRDLPASSSERFDFLLSFEYWKQLVQSQENWSNFNASAYILLKEGVDGKALNVKIRDYIKSKDPNTNVTLLLQPYADKYLHGKYVNGQASGGRIEYVRLFSIIAGFILLIACINFMNLSTARASRRMKEIGIKKAFGVSRASLAMQYLTESIFISMFCLVVAVVMVELSLPVLNEVTGKSLLFHWTPVAIATLVSIAAITGILAGSYPALFLSGFSPGDVLKGRMPVAAGEAWARKGLVVFQFSLTIILISSVLVIHQQIGYIQSRNIGFDKDHVIHFQKEGAIAEKLDAFLGELRRHPDVAEASSISQNIIDVQAFTGDVVWPGKDAGQAVKFAVLTVHEDLIETLGMKVTQGRSFSRDFQDNSSRLMFNEAAIRLMGLREPVGQRITFWGEECEVIGVVGDFHFQSLHETVKPVVFVLASQPLDLHHVMVRLKAGSEASAIEGVRSIYQQFNPGYSFDYQFLDQDFQRQYSSETRVGSLSTYFAGMAVAISCLGLFGLVTFTAERRRKEIGLRKALGSSSLNIVLLLTRDFTRIVIAAIAVGVPISYLVAREWLKTFAFAIELEWWYFLVAGLSALVIAWLTVGAQALKAASTKPAEVLRAE